MDAYIKFENFYVKLHDLSRKEEGGSAFDYFVKLTGIGELLPAVQVTDGQ